MLDRETILGADDLRRETVEVPEWGGTVSVRMLTAEEKVAFAKTFDKAGEDAHNFLAELAVLTLCNERGARLFDANGDVKLLGRKSAEALERVCRVAQELNGLTNDAAEKAVKNSESGQ